MPYEGYFFIEKEKIASIIDWENLSLEGVYMHFAKKEDECIYVMEGERLVGVVTASDWQRAAYVGDAYSCVNSQFSYVEDIDYKSAERLIKKIKGIHEIPVIRNGKFVGVISSGKHKTVSEWNRIRKDNEDIKDDIEYGRTEWYEEQIRELFKYVRPSVYVYFFDEKKLRWTEQDYIIYKRKVKRKSGADGLLEMSNKEQRDFWGEYYSEEYVKEFVENFKKLSQSRKNGITKVEDICSRHFNVSDGCRKVVGQQKAERKIYFIGPCTVFGAYVSDEQTIEYYLYMLLQKNNIFDYEISNIGTMGVTATMAGRLASEAISDNDIVIYWAVDDKRAINNIKNEYSNVKMGSDWIEAYNGIANPAGNVFNAISHCNYKINKRLARIIFNDIKGELKGKSDRNGGGRLLLRDYYIPWEIVRYYREYKDKYELQEHRDSDIIGAIVMNCNPFTKGHQYLIECASERVDWLYIFVVEEDASEFKFEDRFNMVKAGTKDLDHICVLPSGKYIISKETFEDYFDKDSVTEVRIWIMICIYLQMS